MRPPSNTRIVTGLIVLTIGVVFLLDALGVTSLGWLISTYWPLGVITIGVLNLIGQPRQFVWPLFIIGAGAALQLRQLGVINFNLWSTLWPLAIIALGVSLIVRPSSPESHETSDDDQVSGLVAFSGSQIRNASHNFKGGQLTALFGGMEVDLRHARMSGRARIEVFTAFGGVEIRVPETWTVKTNGLPIFGGWENKTATPDQAGSPVLEITGTCLFGGVEIKN